MITRLYFNEQSRTLIDNIWRNASSHPLYAHYNVEKDEATYLSVGAIAITISQNVHPKNMFLFYPSFDNSGKIGSVAIYGEQLQGHRNAIERTMTLFGLPVESIEWDNGLETFLDVTLENYNV